MTDLGLVAAVYRRHKMRTLFTVLSVAVAFAIFLVLTTLYNGFNGVMNITQAKRLSVFGETGNLPLAYAARIKTLPHVASVCHQTFIGGYYREPVNAVVAAAQSYPDCFKVMPEIGMSDGERRAMLADRQGAVVSVELAGKYGWKVGDTVQLLGGPPQVGGGTTWYFHIVGISHSTLPEGWLPNFIANYDYINQGWAIPAMKDTAARILVMTDDARAISRVSHAIDDMFAHSQPTTLTMPDTLLAASVVKMFGDVGAILTAIAAAVFASMLLVAGNTMSGSVRQRMNEFAVMRAVGFSRGRLAGMVLREASIMIGIGAALGLWLGWEICRIMSPIIAKALPYFFVTWQAVAAAVLLAALFSVAVGALPARRVTRLDIADSLRRI